MGLVEEKRDFMFLHGTLFDNKFDIDISVQLRGLQVEKHYHDYIEIVCQVNGQSMHFVDGKEIVLQKNQILIINMNQSHMNLPTQNDTFNIILPKQYLDTLVMESSYEQTVLHLKKFIIEHKKVIAYNLQEHSIDQINKVWNLHKNCATETMYHFKIKLELVQFLIGLDYLFNLESEEKNEGFDIIRYINENLQTACLNEFAKTLNYAPSTISQQISDRYQQSFMDLLHSARLKRAAQLLLTTGYKISYIMHEIGYNNKTFFYSIFKQKYKMTPNQYRIKYKKVD